MKLSGFFRCVKCSRLHTYSVYMFGRVATCPCGHDITLGEVLEMVTRSDSSRIQS